jgi:hypothetical protein
MQAVEEGNQIVGAGKFFRRSALERDPVSHAGLTRKLARAHERWFVIVKP